jgi:hypothetical protein
MNIGETTSGDENNLSLDRLAKDLKNVIHATYGEDLPDIILVGHRYSSTELYSGYLHQDKGIICG